jgi:hypothetical protein
MTNIIVAYSIPNFMFEVYKKLLISIRMPALEISRKTKKFQLPGSTLE